MSRKQLAILILVISVVDGFLIGAIVSATAGPHIGVPLGAAAMALPWLILKGASPLVWRMLALHHAQRQFPLRDPSVFDVKSNVVSMASRRSWLAANNCIEVATDDDALHIRMALPGVPPSTGVSIPWEAVATIDRGKLMSRFEVPGLPPMWLPTSVLEREIQVRQIQVPGESSVVINP